MTKQEQLIKSFEIFEKAINQILGKTTSEILISIHRVPNDFFTNKAKFQQINDEGNISTFKVEEVDNNITLFGEPNS